MPPNPPGTRPGAQAHAFPETTSAALRPAPSGPLEAREGEGALKSLLADLGSQIRRGRGLARGAGERPASCPTGLPGLDARLGGGFPRGRLSELCGAPSSGRTSLATTLLAETLARGSLAAWIDPADAFDPGSAAASLAGREADDALQRLLWVRARSEQEAIRCAERILQTEGFELVVLDLAHARGRAPRGAVRGIRESSWIRLARLAAHGQGALVVLSETPQAGSRAELVLEMQRRRARFSGPPALLDALEATAVLRRHRTRPTGHEVPLSLDVEPEAGSALDPHDDPPADAPTDAHDDPLPD
jgi:hypothetical protein